MRYLSPAMPLLNAGARHTRANWWFVPGARWHRICGDAARVLPAAGRWDVLS